jgi:hypothetical protein
MTARKRSCSGAIGKESSELGREIAVDLKADADFYEHRCRPSHDHFLLLRALAANGFWVVSNAPPLIGSGELLGR